MPHYKYALTSYFSLSLFLSGEVFLQTAHRDLSSTSSRGRRGDSGLDINPFPASSSSFIPLHPPPIQPSPLYPLVHCSQSLTGDIPHAHSLVQTGRHHQVLRRMELGAHHIVIMASQHTVGKRKKKKNIHYKIVEGHLYILILTGQFTVCLTRRRS